MNFGPDMIALWQEEIQSLFLDTVITRIDGGPNWLALTFSSKESLVISIESQTLGLYALTDSFFRSLGSQSQSTPFISAIHARLVNSKLTQVQQLQGDRILRLTLQKFIGAGTIETFSLILELMPRQSNIFLLDQQQKIIELARHFDDDGQRCREPGRGYLPPRPLNATPLTPTMTDQQLIAALPHAQGFCPKLSQTILDLCQKGQMEQARKAIFQSPKIAQKLQNQLFAAAIVFEGATPLPSPSLRFLSQDFLIIRNQAELQRITAQAMKQVQRQIQRKLAHQKELQSWLHRREKAYVDRQKGEAVLQNMSVLQAPGRYDLTYWTENGEETINVELPAQCSPKTLAETFFKRYRKNTGDPTEAQNKILRLQEEVDDLKSLQTNLERQSSIKKARKLVEQILDSTTHPQKQSRKKNKKTLPPHLRYEFNNCLILVGMNQQANRYVTFEFAAPNDLWFHVHDQPGSHVILRRNGASDEEFEAAVQVSASLALFYSKDPHRTDPVDCCLKKHVKPMRNAGLGQVIYAESRPVFTSSEIWKQHLKD